MLKTKMTNPITKGQLIEKLTSLDVPDDTIVVRQSGIGFEDILDVHVEAITNNWPPTGTAEVTAILLS